MPKKLSYSFVKKFIEDRNFKLISTEYKNTQMKLDLICENGHIVKIRFNDFKNGIGCSICSGKKTNSYEYVKEIIEMEHYELISKKYENNRTKLIIKCPKDHVFDMSYHDFQSGNRCPVCFGTPKHTYTYIKNYIENEGYTLLSTNYINAHEKLLLSCPEGNHLYYVKFNDFQQGCRCPVCNQQKTISKQEKEIVDYVKTIYDGVIIENDRSIIKNPLTGKFLELDIYLPELNKAIEFNGSYWHSSIYQEFKDFEKQKQCYDLNINLLIIWDFEFVNNKENCLLKIKNFLVI